MIKYIPGVGSNIFKSQAQWIINPVNCVGVMGKGLALQCKNLYPEIMQAYQSACAREELTPGGLLFHLTNDPKRNIICFATKDDWRDPSRLEWIEQGLQEFVSQYWIRNIESVAFPALGCGNGHLEWKDVKPLMEQYLGALPIEVEVYVPIGEPFPSNARKATAPAAPEVPAASAKSEEPILFWSKGDPEWQFLSNFYHAPIKDRDGNIWPSVEHYYQAQKTNDPAIREKIRLLPTARDSKIFSKSLNAPKDWEANNMDVMIRALKAKFTQNPELREKLLATDDRPLIHYGPWDSFWSTGKDGSGQNQHGKLLMALRKHFRKEQQQEENTPEEPILYNEPQKEDTPVTTVKHTGIIYQTVTLKPSNKYFPHFARLNWQGNKWGAPQQLIVQGDPERHHLLTKGWSVAIVGTRNPTDFAGQIIDRLVHSLANLGNVTIVSDLCPGVGELAHRAALKYKLPTIAVLPMQPFSRLANTGQEILQAGGLVVSELGLQKPWSTDMGELYKRCNRITVALSNLIIPIQASMDRSGTLNCCEQGYDLGIPALVYLPQSDIAANPDRYDGLVAMYRNRRADRWNFTEEGLGEVVSAIIAQQINLLEQTGRSDIAKIFKQIWEADDKTRASIGNILKEAMATNS